MLGWLLTALIWIYQATVSPLLGGSCRFHPSCSNYCAEAIATHGPARGLRLGVSRLLKCHPFHAGGLDPVPERKAAGQPG